jgi:hypothetical protein
MEPPACIGEMTYELSLIKCLHSAIGHWLTGEIDGMKNPNQISRLLNLIIAEINFRPSINHTIVGNQIVEAKKLISHNTGNYTFKTSISFL